MSWPNIVVITIVIKAAENTNPDKAEVNSGLKESQVTRNPAPQQKERYQVPTQSQAHTHWATNQGHHQQRKPRTQEEEPQMTTRQQ